VVSAASGFFVTPPRHPLHRRVFLKPSPQGTGLKNITYFASFFLLCQAFFLFLLHCLPPPFMKLGDLTPFPPLSLLYVFPRASPLTAPRFTFPFVSVEALFRPFLSRPYCAFLAGDSMSDLECPRQIFFSSPATLPHAPRNQPSSFPTMREPCDSGWQVESHILILLFFESCVSPPATFFRRSVLFFQFVVVFFFAIFLFVSVPGPSFVGSPPPFSPHSLRSGDPPYMWRLFYRSFLPRDACFPLPTSNKLRVSFLCFVPRIFPQFIGGPEGGLCVCRGLELIFSTVPVSSPPSRPAPQCSPLRYFSPAAVSDFILSV